MLQALIPKNGPVWTGKKDCVENRAANLWVQYHTVWRPVILIVAEQRGLEPVL